MKHLETFKKMAKKYPRESYEYRSARESVFLGMKPNEMDIYREVFYAQKKEAEEKLKETEIEILEEIIKLRQQG